MCATNYWFQFKHAHIACFCQLLNGGCSPFAHGLKKNITPDNACAAATKLVLPDTYESADEDDENAIELPARDVGSKCVHG